VFKSIYQNPHLFRNTFHWKQVLFETNEGYFLGISSFTVAAMAVPMVGINIHMLNLSKLPFYFIWNVYIQ